MRQTKVDIRAPEGLSPMVLSLRAELAVRSMHPLGTFGLGDLTVDVVQ